MLFGLVRIVQFDLILQMIEKKHLRLIKFLKQIINLLGRFRILGTYILSQWDISRLLSNTFTLWTLAMMFHLLKLGLQLWVWLQRQICWELISPMLLLLQDKFITGLFLGINVSLVLIYQVFTSLSAIINGLPFMLKSRWGDRFSITSRILRRHAFFCQIRHNMLVWSTILYSFVVYCLLHQALLSR